MSIGLIVAANNSFVIGKAGALPWKNSADMKMFKETTLNSHVIMGRKTFESMGSKPLPNRNNIVISSTLDHESTDNIRHYKTIDLAVYASMVSSVFNNTWLIGGSRIYEEGLQYCDTVYITRIQDDVELSDNLTYLPDNCRTLSSNDWNLVTIDNPFDNHLKIDTYKRRHLINGFAPGMFI